MRMTALAASVLAFFFFFAPLLIILTRGEIVQARLGRFETK